MNNPIAYWRLAEADDAELKLSNTTTSYGSANWTYDEIDVTDNSINANPITGTFRSSGSWSFVPAPTAGPPPTKDQIWEDMNRLRFGSLDLTYDDLAKLIEAIEKYGPELGKLHFILYR